MKHIKFLTALILTIVTPVVVMAQPADPGGDPYAAPVNGGLVFVVVIAFIYGVYRIYKLKKEASVNKLNH